MAASQTSQPSENRNMATRSKLIPLKRGPES